MDGVGGTLKNVIFWKLKSGQTVVQTTEDKSCREICAVNYNRICTKGSWDYRAERYRWCPLIQDTLKIHNVERYINQRNEISIKFFKTAADDGPFYTQMYSRVGGLICGHKDPMLMKINAQNAVRIILKMRLNGWSSLYVKNGFMRHVFMVRIFE